ncbi:MAG: methylated-DNA--[protein]-cysteine S-methyltransferase [Actinobacteria bacterium]|nr:methylated-DNA--[protein]-cysteine S-methyltransferase [Actinomycetota bacterium]
MWHVVDTPIGPLRLVAAGGALTAIEFSPFRDRATDEVTDEEPVLLQAAAQLAQYFAGERTEFDLPLAPKGTPFQQRVWAELVKIGYGQTASYGDIAHRLGLTNAASRAVGAANGRNPIPIVVPCHRVIGADGTLTGYAGGIERKRILLDLERPTLV